MPYSFSIDMHVEAFLYLLTRWATALFWKQQIQNGTNFEQGEFMWFKVLGKEKKLWQRQKSGFKIIYENILGNFGWLLSTERIFDEKYHYHQT